jgi:succinate dehydrogenase/fumarate reductase flavoprotein subunit
MQVDASNRGCVVFGRVAGDSAAAYTLQQASAASAVSRLQQVNQHLATTIRVDPQSKKVFLELSWEDATASSAMTVSAPQQSHSEPIQAALQSQAALTSAPPAPVKAVVEEKKQKEFTLEDVAKHNVKSDCWVVVNGQVLDCTEFMADREFFLILSRRPMI